MVRTVHFTDAIISAARILENASLPAEWRALLIRDVHGRIRVAVDTEKSSQRHILEQLQYEVQSLGAFAGEPSILFRDDLFEPRILFEDPSILVFQVPGADLSVRLLDRQVTGQDWLIKTSSATTTVPRVVFFGLKGGVGRSTALTMAAFHLAQQGRRVLAVDLDLESPGLSGLMMPPERLADYGIVDWLVEDAVGQGADIVSRMVSASPLSGNLRAEIRVSAALGNNDPLYLDKLSRCYADIPSSVGVQRFADRIWRLIEILTAQEKPDIILIDSRAGLHDLAGLSIVSLASTALLFASDTAQSWQGYRLLFSHWQSRPEVARFVRERLKIISGLFPEHDQLQGVQSFLERSHTLFTETLYDEIPAGDEVSGENLFNFTMEDSSAPHYPFRIKWNARFQEFDPLQIPKGLFTEDEIRASFGEFLDGLDGLIAETQQ